ncbi:hypothetical protein HBI56_067700 [Parastagonospora nodorum]|uniref:Fungal N-terminal domain-containing protein n=1 Tax=Phaeosphaeria nodorum (strain SN15 / ATCC MYA-4574 / FGSC 10173) TaxID=321614 RepID=A0A7U2ES91_PHANO|nr:hypothetical protein HBH56_002200 [Parastagonospora nodorum]QRC90185.1 hypothetical protein JI435_095910 [Parastagonospora nodorum SN15]KAH3938226.1 hypothetical protein HBH54_002200 [Parastagonospora nodorum]KAH3946530.1 hypothetical protein HBH53_129880 [Parastagonospora nodorum]KAH3975142.1 hypothetical protein HBH51_084960 [Parastagonospora nodorum]
MAEFLGVLSATAQLADQAIRVLGRIRKARQRIKALPGLLAQHESELKSVRSMIGIIEDVKDLQTANVCSEVLRLKEVGDKLIELLKEMEAPRKPVQQLAHQLTNGSLDESRLSGTMSELGQVKSMLLLRIQVANVGVMRDMQQGLVANTEVIARVDQFLRDEVGGCEGLRIARLLHGRRPSNDGTVQLTPADLRSLRNNANGEDSEDETLVDDSDSSTGSTTKKRVTTERIILRNMARDQALQINAPIGKDLWKAIDRIVIEHNTAEGEAVQVNYNNTLEDTIALITLKHKFKLEALKQTSSYGRRDSLMSPP